MFRKPFLEKLCVFSVLIVVLASVEASGMGGKPDVLEKIRPEALSPSLESAPVSNVTLKELAEVYWPETNSTKLQQDETLKNLLGKKVTWEITVAQIQRDGNDYLVQGQSDKDMVGTFSYVQADTEPAKQALFNAKMGSKLKITGIVSDMQLRHIVLKPAVLSN